MNHNENKSLEDIVYFCEIDNKFKFEQWKDIVGYEGKYQVSDLGRVKSLNYKRSGLPGIMSLVLNSGGYYRLILSKDGKPKTKIVHQIECEAFLGHVPCGFERVINHIDFVKTNNILQNFEIVTNRENCDHKHIPSSSKYVGVHWNTLKKRWISQIYFKGKLIFLGHFTNEEEASKYYQNALKSIKNGTEIIKKPVFKTSKYKGVHFEKIRNKWVASIRVKDKIKKLGYFLNEEDARDAFLYAKKNLSN